MKMIKYDNNQYSTSDEALAFMRRNPRRLKPLFEAQAKSMSYTHLEVYKDMWISREYEPWLRMYLEFFRNTSSSNINAVSQSERYHLCYPFLKALYDEGVPNMAWIEGMPKVKIWQPLPVKVSTPENCPNFFKTSLKIKGTLASYPKWIVMSDSKVIIETLKAIWKDELVIYTSDKSATCRCNKLGIGNYKEPRDLTCAPLYMDLASVRDLDRLTREVYNWDRCLVIRSEGSKKDGR